MNLLKNELPPLPMLAIDAEAESERNRLCLAAREITTITDTTSNSAARDVAIALRQHLRKTEEERTRLTRPLLDGQRLLKRLSDDHVAPAQAELTRLERLAADYLQAEGRRVAREQAAQDAKLASLMQERLALERQAVKAASEVQTEAQLAVAIEAEALARHAAVMVQSAVAEPLAKVDKARGQVGRAVMVWEITDILALQRAKPDCVKLTPSAAMIQELVAVGDGTPGIRTWTEYRSTFSTR